MCWWYLFTSPKDVAPLDKHYWEQKGIKVRQENLEWTVSELKALWKEGKRRGQLSVRVVYNAAAVKKAMEEIGVSVAFHTEHTPGDINDIHDKVYYVMDEVSPTPRSVLTG